MKIKCSTWGHVESFYTRKLRGGNTLTMRVPFPVEPGDDLTLALRLPNEMVMAIDATVTATKPTSDERVTAIQLHLHGMTHEVLERLRALVADARAGHEVADASFGDEQTRADPVPPPVVEDAPIDELVEVPPMPSIADVPEPVRDVFGFLDAELVRLRGLGAAEVLGVAWDAEVLEIRRGYFELIRQFHPDIYSAYRSSGIHHLAQEVFIHINRAYDRMRDAAASAGKAVVAGPALMPHQGWMAEFDDIGIDEPMPAPLPAPPPVGLAAVTFTTKRPTRLFDEPSADSLPASPSGPPPIPPGRPPPIPPRARGHVASKGASASEPIEVHEAVTEWEDALGTRGATVQDKLNAANSRLIAAERLADDARKLLATDELDAARKKLTEALQADPRNRSVRALYHVARGRLLVSDGRSAEATAQFEAALSHDRLCHEALESLDALRSTGDKKEGLFRRFFR